MNKNTSKRITRESTIRRTDNQVAAEIEGEVALMSIENGNYYCLNETGSVIWETIAQPCSINEVCVQLMRKYKIEPTQCEAEVLNHVGELVAENLAEVIDAAAA